MDQTVGGGGGASSGMVADLDGFKRNIDGIVVNVDKLEKQLIEVEQCYQSNGNNSIQGNNFKGGPVVKEKAREKHLVATKKPLLLDAARTETAAAKRMQKLMRQFATILRKITQHKWAWPFMEPVDVIGLGLHDYYEVIEKPMDFSTIKSKMEAKDGTGYKNVREIYADVRLIFKNAMKYNNDEKHDVHLMAKGLLEKFEEKWLQFLPKVAEEEARLLEEEAQAQVDLQLAQETAYANMARDFSNELEEVVIHLKNPEEMVIQKCRSSGVGSSSSSSSSSSCSSCLVERRRSVSSFPRNGRKESEELLR